MKQILFCKLTYYGIHCCYLTSTSIFVNKPPDYDKISNCGILFLSCSHFRQVMQQFTLFIICNIHLTLNGLQIFTIFRYPWSNYSVLYFVLSYFCKEFLVNVQISRSNACFMINQVTSYACLTFTKNKKNCECNWKRFCGEQFLAVENMTNE